MSGPRRALVWAVFEVTDEKFDEKALADIVGYVLTSFNEEASIGLEYKGVAKSLIGAPGEKLQTPDEVMTKLVEKVKEKLDEKAE